MVIARFGTLMVATWLAALTWGQGESPAVKPDVTFVVREHSMGADLVEVTMSRADYPTDLLMKQMEDLGARLKAAPRGLAVGRVEIDKSKPELNFVKAKFATDGIIDRAAGVLRIEPILRAMAGAPEPYTIHNVLILFDGERPGPRTVQRHESAAVFAEGRVTASPPMIEYLIRLKTQSPEEIGFPDQVPERSAASKPSEKRSGTPVLFICAVAVASIAAGALVYLALLRGGARGTGRR